MTKSNIREEANTITDIMMTFQGDDRNIAGAPVYEIHDADLNKKGLFLLISWELAEYTQEEENHLFFDLHDESNSHHTAVVLESDLEKNAYDIIYQTLENLLLAK